MTPSYLQTIQTLKTIKNLKFLAAYERSNNSGMVKVLISSTWWSKERELIIEVGPHENPNHSFGEDGLYLTRFKSLDHFEKVLKDEVKNSYRERFEKIFIVTNQ